MNDRVSLGNGDRIGGNSDLLIALLDLAYRCSSRREYLDGVMRLIQKWSGCRCVGIRVLDRKGNIPYESYTGFGLEFWESENWLSIDRDQCACTRVVAGRPEPQDQPCLTDGGSFCLNDSEAFLAGLSEQEKGRFRGVCIAAGFASIGVFPFRWRDKILGVIHLADERAGLIRPELVDEIELIAPMIAGAVNRFDLEEELRRDRVTETVINSLLRLSLVDISLEDLLRRALHLVLTIPWLSCELGGAIFLVEEETGTLVLKAHEGLSDGARKACARVSPGHCLCGEAAVSGRLRFSDHRDPVDGKRCVLSSVPHGHYCVPILSTEKLLGMITVRSSPAHEPSKKDEHFLMAISDSLAGIIIRKRAEEARERLAEETERRAAELQSVLDNMVDGVFVCDVEGRLTLINEAGEQMMGLDAPKNDALSMSLCPDLLQIRHLDGNPLIRDELPPLRALRGEVVVGQDGMLRNHRTGCDFYIRSNASPIFSERGEIVGAVMVARDVTDLIELDAMKDAFISVAAHELKTPVAVMKGYAQALLRIADGLTPPRRKMLEAIDRGSDRIDTIVRELLDISRLQLGRLEMESERIDLPALVELVADRMALTVTKHDIRVVRAEPVVIRGDRDRLEQVLINLVDNAVRYSPAGGDVQLEVAVQGDDAVVSVRDQGVGIPAEKQDGIFQRFFRAHTGTPYDYGGMGVGLYISREIASRHGGQMRFESQEGIGSVFHLSLPLRGDHGGS